MGRFLKVGLGVLLGGLLLVAGFSALFSIATDTGEEGEDVGLSTLVAAATDALDDGDDAPPGKDGASDTDEEEAPADPPRSFSGPGGNSTKGLGTIKVSTESELRWRHRGDPARGGFFIVQDVRAGLDVNSDGRQGARVVPPGTYREVQVIASGPWTMTIGPR